MATSVLAFVRARRSVIAFDITVLVLAELLVLSAVSPGNVLSDVLPLNGDNSGHPYAIQMMADAIKHARLNGWSNGWLSGFPVGTFYPWVADVVAALLSFVLPISVAYKLVVVSGVLLLPISAYTAARWAGLPRPFPALFAVFCLPQIFDVSCNICGGSLNSVLTGEYAYELGIPLGLLAVGATARALRDEGSRALAAVLVGLALLAHPITALWTSVAIAATVAAHLIQSRQLPARWIWPAVAAAALAVAWWLPFLVYRSYTPKPLFTKATEYSFFLFPSGTAWEWVVAVLTIAGLIAALRTRLPFIWGLSFAGLVAFAAVYALPESQLPNLRVIPLWFTVRWLLVAFGVFDLAGRAANIARSWTTNTTPRWVHRLVAVDLKLVVPALALVFVAVVQGVPWGLFPGEQFQAPPGDPLGAGHQKWLGMTLPGVGQSVVAAQTFAGYKSDAASREAYPAVIATLRDVAAREGCGRIAADEGGQGEPYYLTYHLLDQLPLLTHDCLSYVVGTRGDSSLNFPAALGAVSAISQSPEQQMPYIPYFQYNLATGIPLARLLGLKYYMTYDDVGNAAAARDPDLSLLATTNGTKIWQVADAALVAPLANQPVTVAVPGDVSWQSYYLGLENAGQFGSVYYSPSGPSSWPSVDAGQAATPQPLPANAVQNISERGGTIAFDVTHPGIPVIVRTTYFPGWHVSGGAGPYQANPDYMIVVPSGTHVVLTYRTTGVTWVANLVGLLGVVGVIALGVVDLRERRPPKSKATPMPRTSSRPAKPSRASLAKRNPASKRAGTRAKRPRA